MTPKTQKALKTLIKVEMAALENLLIARKDIAMAIDLLTQEKELTVQRLRNEVEFQGDPSATMTLIHFAKACEDKVISVNAEIQKHEGELSELQTAINLLHHKIKRFEFLLSNYDKALIKEANKQEQEALDEAASQKYMR